MRIGRVTAPLAIFVLFCACETASAQDGGKTGITMAVPGAFGILWHANDKVAVRPTINFSHSTVDASGNNSSWSVGATLAALFYVKKYDNVRTYFSPRYSFSRSRSVIHLTATTQGTTIPDITSVGTSNGGAGTFGAEYSPGSRFSVFGEVGVAFSRLTTSVSGLTSSNTSGNAWGTTAGVGVIFYP